MKVECLHGYFIFEETGSGQISDFMSRFGVVIVKSGDHFTFGALVDAPNYSLPGGTFLGAPTLVNFEGRPWDVMRANGLVYNIGTGLVVPILSILQAVQVQPSGNFFLSSGMIQPGSITDDGLRVTDYSAFYLESRLNFKYSEIDYE